jgi:anti-sigma factor RsiW
MNTLPNGTPIDDDLLHDYADGILPDDQAHELAQIMRHDAPLRAQYAEVQARQQALRALVRLEAPDKGFSKAVLAKWQAEQALATRPKPITNWRLMVVPVGLGALLLTMLGYVLISTLVSPAQVGQPSIQTPGVVFPAVEISDWQPYLSHPAWYLVPAMGLGYLTLRWAEYWFTQRVR